MDDNSKEWWDGNSPMPEFYMKEAEAFRASTAKEQRLADLLAKTMNSIETYKKVRYDLSRINITP